MSRCIAVLVIACSLVIAAGCGGDEPEGGDGAATSVVEPSQSRGETETVPERPASADRGGAESAVPPEVRERRQELDIRPGADNSLQTFGEEPGEREHAEVVEALRDFLTALASDDFVGACNDFSASLRESNQQLVDRFRESQGRPPARGCSDLGSDLRRLSSGSGLGGQARNALNGEVLRVGVESETGRTIVIISQGDGELVHFPMVLEDGRWKPYAIAPKPVRAGS